MVLPEDPGIGASDQGSALGHFCNTMPWNHASLASRTTATARPAEGQLLNTPATFAPRGNLINPIGSPVGGGT